MKRWGSFYLLLVLAGLGSSGGLFAQSWNSSQNVELPGNHRGKVTALLLDSRNRILSAGEDGFLEIWSIENNAAVDRYQLTPYAISFMALRPGKPQIAIAERDEIGLCRISAWDYETKKNLFTLGFQDTVSSINYSAAGGFLMITWSGSTGIARIHPETGQALKSPEALSGQAFFAATGRSERNMICYLSSGVISYWDLETGNEIERFTVPANISSPLLLGNNRFLTGFDALGLLILDAVSGSAVTRNAGMQNGVLFTGAPESTEFICLIPNEGPSGGSSTIYHFYINGSGELETKNRRTLPSNLPGITAGTVVSSTTAALGTAEGNVLIFSQSGSVRVMNTRNQLRITDMASSSQAIGFITEDSRLGFIPLDYNQLDSRNTLSLQDSGIYTRITSDNEADSGFLLWQSDNTRSFPLIKTLTGRPESGVAADTFIDKVTFRFPLRSVSVYRDRYLFLDLVGNLSVTDQKSGELKFTFTATGAQDADFIDENNILIGRSAGAGNTAFLMVNIETEETVSLAYPAAIGNQVYRGGSGAVYGVAINRESGNFKTSVVNLNTTNPAQSKLLVDYSKENTRFSMGESSGVLAASIGGDRAAIYRLIGNGQNTVAGAQPLERTPGLPVRILGGSR
jgi:hypothetical protein